MEDNIMKVNLKVWRQANPREKGGFVTYENVETTPDTSFLETLDILNERLIEEARSPSCSTTTAARVSAACARFMSTAIPTAPPPAQPLASSTCVVSRTERQSRWSLGARLLSPSSKTLWSIATRSTRSSRPAATSASTAAVLRMPTTFPSPR